MNETKKLYSLDTMEALDLPVVTPPAEITRKVVVYAETRPVWQIDRDFRRSLRGPFVRTLASIFRF